MGTAPEPDSDMEAANALQSLQEEATCPICLEYFREPVSVECGHNFCRACITQCWEGLEANVSCPQCRETVQQRNFRPNRQLANVVEIARRLSVQPAGGERVCGEHQEGLKLFCKEDQTPICVVCHLSRAHRAHTVVPIEEAAQEYKDKIQAHLKTLREEREKLLGFKVTEEEKSQEYLEQIEKERQKIVSEFQQLRQFLEEQERHLLAQLEKLDKETVKTQDENISKLSGEISLVSELINELEGKCQKPANEFLQDIRNILTRCEKGKFQQPEEISPELEKGLSNFSQKTVALMETLRTFKDTLPSALERTRGGSLESFTQVSVTLDPDTAHPCLTLSEDEKTVTWADTWQNLPDNPERFDTELYVLGREGFTSGRHCWEVEVGDGRHWAIGVARESGRRKGGIILSPEGGIWALGWMENQFQALTSPSTTLPLIRDLSRIQVCLDCDQGQVKFFSVGDKVPIFTFPPGSVHGGKIHPWLKVVVGIQLRLCP